MKITETDQNLVDSCKDKLMEHFDSVRIFVTRHDGGSEETAGYTVGGGNFFAQLGQIKEWKAQQDEFTRGDARQGASGE